MTSCCNDDGDPRDRDHPHGDPSPLNPLGIKGVGEAGAIPVPALIAEAVDDALAPFGVRVREMRSTRARARARGRGAGAGPRRGEPLGVCGADRSGALTGRFGPEYPTIGTGERGRAGFPPLELPPAGPR